MTGTAEGSRTTVADALANARKLLLSNPESAARQAREIIRVEPAIAEAHFMLAAALRGLAQESEASTAEQQGLAVCAADPVLQEAAGFIATGRLEAAEELLRQFVMDTPNDPEALRLLASVARQGGHLDAAEGLLRRSLRIAPGMARARDDLFDLIAFHAVRQPDRSSSPAIPPEGPEEFSRAIDLNRKTVDQTPNDPRNWLSYGHVLRLSGSQSESIAAYRRAVTIEPRFGEAWWALADLKTIALTDEDVRTMERALADPDASDGDRVGLHFALGKALTDRGSFEPAFGQYSAGNRLKRRVVAYDPNALDDLVETSKQGLDHDFFAKRDAWGARAQDPIFVIGMPRSGSTLLEQMLASHSAIEGTEELVYLGNLASAVAGGRRAGLEKSDFVDGLVALSSERIAQIGEAYLARAATHRRTNRPRFIDKMPRNWMYLGLLRLALPNAKIIDVRRDALDCCWSNYRQLFADGGEFSYDLTELGRYYSAYTDLIDHFDRISPGAIFHLQYERLVDEPEQELRRLFDYLDLPFEESSLDFHSNPRAVKTASSEQVRQPLNSRGLGVSVPFRPYLGDLIAALEVKPGRPPRVNSGTRA